QEDGWPVFEKRLEQLLAYTARATKAELAKFPRGAYSFTDYIDDDGIEANPIPIVVNLRFEGERIVADFTGTSPQVKGAINCTLGWTASAVYVVVASLIDSQIPKNAGFFSCIEVIAPPGTVLNLRRPA